MALVIKDLMCYFSQVAVTLGVLLVSPLVKRHLYQIFLFAHQAAAISFVVALWFHVDAEDIQSRTILFVGTVSYVSIWILQTLRALYINLSRYPRPHGSVGLWRILRISRIQKGNYEQGVYTLSVSVARTSSIRPGSYVYVRFCTWHHASWIQSHPCMVVWRQDHRDPCRDSHIDLAIRTGSDPALTCKGWTEALLKGCSEEERKRIKSGHDFYPDLNVWFGGPYGRTYDSGSSNLGDHDHVLLIAQGMGIYALMPLMDDLVERSKRRTISTRRIKLAWDLKGIAGTYIKPHLRRLIKECNDHIMITASSAETPAQTRDAFREIGTIPFINVHMHCKECGLPQDAKDGIRMELSLEDMDGRDQIREEARSQQKKVAVVGEFYRVSQLFDCCKR